MLSKSLAFAAAFVTVVAIQPAAARPRTHAHAARSDAAVSSDWAADFFGGGGSSNTERSGHRTHQSSRQGARQSSAASEGRHSGLGPRPSAWCGWYMRSRHGGGPEYNLAANWRHYGSPASPQVGAIVVWPHHVGEIVGQNARGQWIVLSGNYSGGVHQTARSIAGATVRL